MCFNNPFIEEKQHQYAINTSEYIDYLSGSSSYLEKFKNVHYQNVSIQESDFFIGFETRAKAEKSKIIKTTDVTVQSWAWLKGVMKCFTYNVPHQPGMLNNLMHIRFKNSIFPNAKRPSDGWNTGGLQLFFHYPSQFARSFPTNQRFWPVRPKATKYRMRFYMKGMEVLKRRHKEYQVCSKDVKYDAWLVQNITRRINCTPPYWLTSYKLPLCTTKEELKQAKDMFWDIFYGVVEMNTPCNEISKLDLEYEDAVDVSDLRENETKLSVYFRNKVYKEIRQIRAYTFMSLIGNVGGFVGLLLGYALVQIPGTVFVVYNYFKTESAQMLRKRNTVEKIRPLRVCNKHENMDGLCQNDRCLRKVEGLYQSLFQYMEAINSRMEAMETRMKDIKK